MKTKAKPMFYAQQRRRFCVLSAAEELSPAFSPLLVSAAEGELGKTCHLLRIGRHLPALIATRREVQRGQLHENKGSGHFYIATNCTLCVRPESAEPDEGDEGSRLHQSRFTPFLCPPSTVNRQPLPLDSTLSSVNCGLSTVNRFSAFNFRLSTGSLLTP